MMEIDTQAMLELISNFLKRDDVASRELWQVLTALRGPDDGDERLKEATTGVIRHKLLGDTSGLNGAVFAPDDEFGAKMRVELDRDHFTVHARKAFAVLGLDWLSVNKP